MTFKKIYVFIDHPTSVPNYLREHEKKCEIVLNKELWKMKS